MPQFTRELEDAGGAGGGHADAAAPPVHLGVPVLGRAPLGRRRRRRGVVVGRGRLVCQAAGVALRIAQQYPAAGVCGGASAIGGEKQQVMAEQIIMRVGGGGSDGGMCGYY